MNTACPNHLIENRCVPSIYEGFGIRDAKGREFGMRLRVWTAEAVAGPAPLNPDGSYNYLGHATALEPGTWYVCNIHATRAGDTYGALQSDNYFRTEDERHAYIAKRRADGSKRALKRQALEQEKLELKRRIAAAR